MEDTEDRITKMMELWKELKNDGTKTRLIIKCAKEFGKSPNTIHNHWFSRFWQVPEEYQLRVIEIFELEIRLQNE